MVGREWHVAAKGEFFAGFPLEIDDKPATGSLWCAGEDDGERDFAAFYPYTSLEGFAAYNPLCKPEKIILVNKDAIRFIYFE